MSESIDIKTILKQSNVSIRKQVFYVLLGCVGLGVLSFFIGLLTGSAQAVWQALLINTLFFAGVSYGSLIFSVIFSITNAKWGRPIKRMAEATVLFIPVSWLLYGVLFFGMDHFFEWTDPAKIIAAKSWWLNMSFFISRHAVLMLVTGIVGIIYVKTSLKPDIFLIQKMSPSALSRWSQRLLSSEIDKNQDAEKNHKRHLVLAPVFALLYTILACIIAFDWIMSIDQEWYSTLFGFQYAIANLFAAGAFLIIFSSILRKKAGLEAFITPSRHNDLSRLVFAFSILWTYLIFSQILVIWYANIPEEVPYVILRMNSDLWSGMFYFLFFTLFFVPFFGLLTQKACRSNIVSSIIAGVILIGLWFEKYFLIVPSIQENLSTNGKLAGINFSLWDLTITIGMTGMFVLCLLLFLSKFPIVPISDPLFQKQEKSM